MLERVTVRINESLYSGFSTFTLQRSIDSLCGRFSLTIPMTPDNSLKIVDAFRPGRACTLFSNSDQLLTGYIDNALPHLDDNSFELRITGRDKTADLIDCSAVHSPGQWKNVTVHQVAYAVAEPFGLSVKKNVDVGDALKSVTVEEGESPYQVIENACRKRGLISITDEYGRVVLTNVGEMTSHNPLLYGDNISTLDGDGDGLVERFSEYIVKSQNPGDGGVSAWSAGGSEAKAQDTDIERYRPKVLASESNVDTAGAQTRANWEATVRAARSMRLTARVNGWRQTNGDLWKFNSLSWARIPNLGIDQEVLIAAVLYTQTGDDISATLTLSRRDAYQQLPKNKTTKKGINWV